MNIEILKQSAELALKSDRRSDVHDVAVFALYHAMDGEHREEIMRLVTAEPIQEDGDICPKKHLNDLVDWGLARRIGISGGRRLVVSDRICWDIVGVGIKLSRHGEDSKVVAETFFML